MRPINISGDKLAGTLSMAADQRGGRENVLTSFKRRFGVGFPGIGLFLRSPHRNQKNGRAGGRAG